MADKSVSFRLGVVGGDRARAEFVKVGNAGRDAFRDVDRFSRSGSNGLQNFGFQVQDFAVQIGAGTSASQALAQQLPQLLSGFGLLGVALGTTAAIAIPLGSALLGVKEKAESLDAVLGNMNASVKELEETSRAFTAGGITDLIEKYGELNAEVLLLIQRQRELAVSEALGQAQNAIAAMNAEIGALFRNRVGELADFLGVEGSVRQVDSFGNAIRAVNPVIRDFEAGLVAVSEATTFEEQAAAVAALLDAMDGTAAKGGELYRSFVEAESALRAMKAAGGGVNGWLDAAIAGASDLAGELWDAARAAFTVGQGQAAALTQENIDAAMAASALAYGKIQNTGEGGADQAAREAIARRPNPFGRLSSGAAGVSRSTQSSGGVPRISDDELEAARIFNETRTAAEKYAIELKKLNDLKASGALDSDTYARAMDALKNKTDETADAMKVLESSVGEAFTSFVTGAKSGQEALADLLASLADTLANSAFQSIAGSLFGGGGKFLSAIFGGARAGGGPVLAGRSYMVGESGPEMVTMGGNGYVTSNAALRSAVGAGGGPVINIDARGAVEGTAAMIAKAIQRAAPAIVKQSVSANRAAGARGY
ncbi:MAG: hypothetical protein ACK5PF_12175 [bacterium]|jgi:hypothetical protein